MNFFAPAPSMDVRACEPVGLDSRSDALLSRVFYPDWAGALKSEALNIVEVVSGCQELAGLERGEPGNCATAELVHRCVDDQRYSRGDWSLGAGGCQRNLCAGAGISSGCDQDSDAPGGGRWRACEPRSAGLDLVFANATFGTVATARTQREGKTLGAVAGGVGDCDFDSGGAGNVDAPDGASDRASASEGFSGPLKKDLCSFRSIQFPVEAGMETLAEAGGKFEHPVVGHEYDDVTGGVEDR